MYMSIKAKDITFLEVLSYRLVFYRKDVLKKTDLSINHKECKTNYSIIITLKFSSYLRNYSIFFILCFETHIIHSLSGV